MNVKVSGFGIGGYADSVKENRKTGMEERFPMTFAENVDSQDKDNAGKPVTGAGTPGVNIIARSRITESIWKDSTVVKECTVRYAVFEEGDYAKASPEEGCQYKTKVDMENQTVYIERKNEDGTIQACEVDMAQLDTQKSTDNPAEMIAIEAWQRAKKSQEKQEAKEEEDPFKKAVEEFSVFVKDRMENGDIKIPIGGGEFSEKEWNKLLTEVDEALTEIKKSTKEEAEKRVEEIESKRKTEEAIRKKLREELSTDGKAPYSWLADGDGTIVYNGVTFSCDNNTRSINLGDTSNRDNVLSVPLSGGGTLNVNRDNLDDLAKAIGMFSPEDVKRIMNAIATDAQCQKKLLEIEEEKNKIMENAAEDKKAADIK